MPSGFKAILTRMTAGLPDQRFQSADELLRAIDVADGNRRVGKTAAIMAVGAAVLMVVAFITLSSSPGDAENVTEPTPIIEEKIPENVEPEPKQEAKPEPEKQRALTAIEEREAATWRQDFSDYKKEVVKYHRDLKIYLDWMEKEGRPIDKRSLPIPPYPPIMVIPRLFTPEELQEYDDALKEWEKEMAKSK